MTSVVEEALVSRLLILGEFEDKRLMDEEEDKRPTLSLDLLVF